MANLLAQAMSKQVVLENKPTSWRLEFSWRLVNKHFGSFRSYLLALLHIFSFLFNYVLWWLNVKKKKNIRPYVLVSRDFHRRLLETFHF